MHKGEVKERGVKNGNESVCWILLLDSPFKIITILLVSKWSNLYSIFIMENEEPFGQQSDGAGSVNSE